jgi:type 1 glutamine amidotransferase
MWTIERKNGQRVFYTRFDPADAVKNEGVRDLIVRAIFWAARRKEAAMKKAGGWRYEPS